MQDHRRHAGWSPESEAHDGAFAVPYLHRLRFTSDALDAADPLLARLITAEEEQGPRRVLVFVDEGVARAWPRLGERIIRYAATHDRAITLADAPVTIAGGEACKNGWDAYETVARAISDGGICRHSFVLAIGGGAVLDAVGFAAGTAHRGVRLVRMPTTTLSQADSGVGVKNGINAFGKKNFLGAFNPPWAVINDESFLTTLSDRDWRCGLSEAVKVGLLKDAACFEQIARLAPRLSRRDHAALRPVIRRSAWLHLHHIVDGGDPFELKEARPLDFGHWSAHRIEQMTDYAVRHGEAVAIGIALDSVYSAMSGMLEWSELKAILDCLGALGFELDHPAVEDTERLFGGLEEFREHLGGELTITLLAGIGSPVDVHEIDRRLMGKAARLLVEMAPRPRRRTLDGV